MTHDEKKIFHRDAKTIKKFDVNACGILFRKRFWLFALDSTMSRKLHINTQIVKIGRRATNGGGATERPAIAGYYCVQLLELLHYIEPRQTTPISVLPAHHASAIFALAQRG